MYCTCASSCVMVKLDSPQKNKFNLNNFIKEQKSNLEDLYIVQLAKNIIDFKRSKFNELKEFLEFKAQRWEKIIKNEKSKLEEFFSSNDLLNINNYDNYQEAKLEDIIELIKLKKLKVDELLALNNLLELKRSKIEEVRNLINYKKSKVQDLLTNNILASSSDSSVKEPYQNVKVVKAHMSFDPSTTQEAKPTSDSVQKFPYQQRTPSKQIRYAKVFGDF